MCERSIFQTFWKKHSCAKFLSFELETSNFGSSYVFSSPSKWGGRFLPNLTFWTPKRHISGKCRYHYSKICVSWDKCMKFWLQPWFWEPVKIGGSDFTQFDVKNSKTAYFRYIGSNYKSYNFSIFIYNAPNLCQNKKDQTFFWRDACLLLPLGIKMQTRDPLC